MTSPKPLPQDRHGVSLIEVLVALILLSIALSALASLSYQVALRSFDSATESYTTGVATEQLGLLSVVAYDSLPGQTGCTEVTSGHFPHQRCISVADVSHKMREITLVITPALPYADADTVVVRRSRPALASPFN